MTSRDIIGWSVFVVWILVVVTLTGRGFYLMFSWGHKPMSADEKWIEDVDDSST